MAAALLFKTNLQQWGTPTKKSTYEHTAGPIQWDLPCVHSCCAAPEHCCKGLGLLCLEEPPSWLPYTFIFFLSSMVNETSFQSFPFALQFSLLPI